MTLSKAVVTLVRRPDGKILGVSRGLSVRDIGLPGGHVEAFDGSLAQAAARELHEETGVVTAPDGLRPVFQGGRPERPCIAFVAHGPLQIPPILESVPFEGFVRWHDPEAFLRPSCTYRSYQQQLFHLLEIVP